MIINCIWCRPALQHEATQSFTDTLCKQRNDRTWASLALFWALRSIGLCWPRAITFVFLPVSFSFLVSCSQPFLQAAYPNLHCRQPVSSITSQSFSRLPGSGPLCGCLSPCATFYYLASPAPHSHIPISAL